MVKEAIPRRAGGSVGATLPKELAHRLRLEAGDRVLVVETDNGILITPYDSKVEQALSIAKRVARKYRSALRQLSK